MTPYLTTDMQLTLPDSPLEDLSMNILKFSELGTTLVITRGVIAAGQTLAESFDAQVQKLQQQSGAFQSRGRREIGIGAAGEIAAVEIEHQLSRGQERLWQYQLACELPQSGGPAGTVGRMLALSYVKHTPLAEQDRAQWEALKASVCLLAAASATGEQVTA